ncbi:Primosomal replication protein N [Rubrivivax sp. A210]|uniref:primosomal replication protein N n=1 Tax=Rubrivivax sp. A210 TaxID=2772301 RepID=UPI0019183790|nr:primosomal replication protein N [Rubrivivax sp. A210]CAD5367250.1 Primosomal replication protein N [Rubrivivax sp. A210]
MNRLVLAAALVERAATRFTPAGLPALDLGLKHESEVSEDGQPRKVSMEMRAVAIGAVTQGLLPLALGSACIFAGFITSTRNGRGLLFHITSVEPDARTEPIRIDSFQ